RLSASPRTNPQNRRSAGFLHAFLSQNLKGPPQESDTLLTGQAPIIEALLSRGGGFGNHAGAKKGPASGGRGAAGPPQAGAVDAAGGGKPPGPRGGGGGRGAGAFRYGTFARAGGGAGRPVPVCGGVLRGGVFHAAGFAVLGGHGRRGGRISGRRAARV